MYISSEVSLTILRIKLDLGSQLMYLNTPFSLKYYTQPSIMPRRSKILPNWPLCGKALDSIKDHHAQLTNPFGGSVHSIDSCANCSISRSFIQRCGQVILVGIRIERVIQINTSLAFRMLTSEVLALFLACIGSVACMLSVPPA
jgi:hypothetical protein